MLNFGRLRNRARRHLNGVIVTDTNATAIVTRSTIARNTGADFDQSNGSVLRSSTNNTLTGQGAPDINGTLTSSPLN